MQHRLLLFAGATLAGLLLVAGASAMSMSPSIAKESGTQAKASHVLPAIPGVPDSPAARKAKKILVFGAEQDVDGFNTALNCCSEYWAGVIGNTTETRGAFIITSKLAYKPDLISSFKVGGSPWRVTYFIRKNANWSDGVPVSAADFIYTWKQIVNPNNDVASRTGYDQITRATQANHGKTVTFFFKAPFADWKDLFSGVYPSHALRGQDFNKIWANCVCGVNGKPISDGPFLLTSYRKGTDATLVANPKWYGTKPKLHEIVFRFIQDTNSEIQAMRGGEVDAIAPSPQTALSQLQHQSGIVYDARTALYFEHIDLSGHGNHNPLMEQPWFREAVISAIDRQALVRTFYSAIFPSEKPMNSLLFYPADGRYHADFAKWSFNPSRAIKLLRAHGCTGGPATAGAGGIYTCNGQKASILERTISSNKRRLASFAIFQEELKNVGIDLRDGLVPDANTLFGTGPNSILAGNWDIAEYAWVTTPDPSAFSSWLECAGSGGDSNYMTFCDKTITKWLHQADRMVNAQARAALLNKADKRMSGYVPVIPLYSQPVILVHKSSVKGMGASNNPASIGPTWNAEDWHF
jgi:peptide/nickel transport system substrate-binding protein